MDHLGVLKMYNYSKSIVPISFKFFTPNREKIASKKILRSGIFEEKINLERRH